MGVDNQDQTTAFGNNLWKSKCQNGAVTYKHRDVYSTEDIVFAGPIIFHLSCLFRTQQFSQSCEYCKAPVDLMMAFNKRCLPDIHQANVLSLNVLLLGEKQSGKSSVGNALIGKYL